MKCDCGLEHRIKIEDKSFPDDESLFGHFASEFDWALGNGRSRFAITLGGEDTPDLTLIEGRFEGETVAYSVVNYSSGKLFYIERKHQTDPARFGFHKEAMAHLKKMMPKDQDIIAILPRDEAQDFLCRFGFKPFNPDNKKDSWVLKRSSNE